MNFGDGKKGRSVAPLNGRLTKALAIESRSHHGLKEKAELRAVAAILLENVGDLDAAEMDAVQRFKGGENSPSERRLISGIIDRGAFTNAERRIVEAASRSILPVPEPEPEPPEDIDLLRRIGEAAAIVEARRGLHAQVQERFMLADIDRRRVYRIAKSTDEEKAAVDARAQRAHDDLRDAHGAWERAQSTLGELQVNRERMRRSWRLERSVKKVAPQ